MSSQLPLLAYHSYQTLRLNRTPILAPLLIVVTEGTKQIRLGQRLLTASAGSWLALPGQQRVEIINQPDPHSGHYHAWALGQLDSWRQRLHELFASQLARLPLQSTAEAFEPTVQAREAFAKLLALLPSAELGSLQAAQAEHAWQGLILALAAAGQGGALYSLYRRHTTERVLQLLRSDLSRDWPAAEAAAMLAMSSATLRRKLAGEGTSFSRLRQDARMEQALGLVGGSEQALSEVAAACGYQSPSRFATAFQRQFGCTPSSLRQMSNAGVRSREVGAPA
jgi:AraC-like DNA-binding protein